MRGSRPGGDAGGPETRLLEQIAGSVPFGLAVLDAELRYRFVNGWLAALHGVPAAHHVGRTVGQVVPDQAGQVEHLLHRALGGPAPVVEDLLLADPAGGPDKRYRLTALRVALADDAPAVVVLTEDRTEQTVVEQALQESEHRFRTLADAAPVMVWLSGPDFAVEFVNDEVCRFTGRSRSALLGARWQEAVHPDDLPGLLDTAARAVSAGARFAATYRLRAADGSWRWVDLQARLRLPGPTRSYVGVIIDVDAQRRSQEELVAQATSDELTGLLNRAAFLKGVATALHRIEREPGPLALLYLDLDGFKRVNDVLGHGEGDRVLREIGRRLAAAVRPFDLVGRLGGDEFGVLLGGASRPTDAVRVATRIHRTLAESAVAGQLAVSASVGVAFATGPGDSPDALVRRADTAMFQAKASGDAVVVYDDSLGREVRLRQELLDDLRVALAEQLLGLAFQPALRVGGTVAGVEALVRWAHPTKGLLEAREFMDLAAETSLAADIDRWVLRLVAEQLATWRHTLGDAAPTWIAVNVSPGALLANGFVDAILDELRMAELAPRDLVVQVSEPLVGDLGDALLPPLRSLQRSGVRIAHDDVGEGPTSLRHLFTAPADIVMLGPTVLARAVDDPTDGLSRSLAGVAERRGSVLLAEGVESRRHEEVALSLGCTLLQGHAIAPPMTASDIEAWLGARRGNGGGLS